MESPTDTAADRRFRVRGHLSIVMGVSLTRDARRCDMSDQTGRRLPLRDSVRAPPTASAVYRQMRDRLDGTSDACFCRFTRLDPSLTDSPSTPLSADRPV